MVELCVDESTEHVALMKASEDPVAFILSILTDPRVVVEEMLCEDPNFGVVGCYTSLSAFESLSLSPVAIHCFLLPRVGVAMGLEEASRQGW